jgi:tetratricopeptide (TPR) repeat protein
VIDDAQWIDPSSRTLLRRLSGDPPRGWIAFVATVRSDEPDDWGAGGPVTPLRLGPLSSEDSRRLASALLADVGSAEDLAELAWLRGGGNPLFVEEVSRALRDGAEALRDAARVEVALSRARERIPETLHAVVAARIDALPEHAKQLVEAAAVVGEPFALDLIREVEPRSAADVEGVLAGLLARGLMERSAKGAYDFRHGVVRSGAYAQLVRERRADLHRRVADAVAKSTEAESPDGAARIGHHYARAGDTTTAVHFLLRAGNGYGRLRALAEAVAHLRSAFELLREEPRRDASLEASVGLALAAALAAQDRSGEAAAVLESLAVDGAGAGDRSRLAMARIQAGWVRFSNDNELVRARRLIEEGLRLTEGMSDADDIRLLAHNYLARIDLLDGEIARGLLGARRMGEIALARGDVVSLALSRQMECSAHADAGHAAEARATAQQALFEVRGCENAFALGLAEVTVGRVHLLEGDPEAALGAARRAIEAGAQAGQVGLCYHGQLLRGLACLLAGAPRQADAAFAELAALNDRWPSTWLHRGRGRRELGQLEEAAELAARCLSVGPPRAVRARALALRGAALGLGAGSRDEAELLLAEAVDLCDALGLRPALAESYAFRAEILERRGDTAGAEAAAALARELYARCGMHAYAARVLSGAASSAPRASA